MINKMGLNVLQQKVSSLHKICRTNIRLLKLHTNFNHNNSRYNFLFFNYLYKLTSKNLYVFLKSICLLLCGFCLSGCFLTKVVTVPMRVGGAIISVVPVAGRTADAAIDKAADIIDDIPI